MKITVNIRHDELYRIMGGQPVHAGLHVNKILRERGIPIVGTLWIETVDSGTLMQYRYNGDFVYVWDSEPPASKFNLPVYDDPDEI